VDPNTAFEPSGLNSFLREGFLFNGESQGIDFTAEMTDSLARVSAQSLGNSMKYTYLNGETTPATADFKNSVTRLYASLAQHMVNFP
jgi:hypothetical protein